jgi:hypothetical protein
MASRESDADLERIASKLASLFGEPDASYVPPALDEPPADDVSDADLRREFHLAMIDIYRRSNSEIGYNPTRFAQMLGNRGGLDTAQSLIRSENPSDGYVTLWEHRRLDLSVEFVACSPHFRSLFSTADLERARRRLKDWGMDPDDYF